MNTIESNRLRSIYLLPNLLTIASLFAGFFAIVSAMHHQFERAAIAILISMVFDGMDGRVARLTNSSSAFGAQLDSLSDMVCFGVAPALVMYTWALHQLGKPGWLAAFTYTVCTALRLARFNIQPTTSNKHYFKGLSTTAAAGLVAGIVWVGAHYQIDGGKVSWLIAALAILIGMLKVSTIPYHSFKEFRLRRSVPFAVILAAVMALVLISFDPHDILLALFTGYALSGPVMLAWKWLRHRKLRTNPVKKETKKSMQKTMQQERDTDESS